MAVELREFIWEHETEGKGILGTLDDEGVVTFAIVAGAGSSIRGTTYFNAMVDYFGEEAREVLGVWLKPHPDRESTNIDKVNELTARGVPLEEAVLYAWTVTRARKRGFTDVRVITALGGPGAYTRLEVAIARGQRA